MNKWLTTGSSSSFGSNWEPYETTGVHRAHQNPNPNSNHGGARGGGGGKRSVVRSDMGRPSQQPPVPNVRPVSANPPNTVKIPEGYNNLNKGQRTVVESVLSGHSTFFSGPAGSGKSHVVSSIMTLNEEAQVCDRRNIVLTATTGIASCAIGGCTIHSFAGVGLAKGRAEEIVGRASSNRFTKKRWQDCDVLLIDEISMMAASFMEILDHVGRRTRRNNRPFGGIQLVLCGDFFQLPPVDLSSGFAFQAKIWGEAIKVSVLLVEVFRQGGDGVLLDILNEARVGELSDKSIGLLRLHCAGSRDKMRGQKDQDGDGANIKPTLLESRNTNVDSANKREMGKLPGKAVLYRALDNAITPQHQGQLERNSPAATELTLKIGAQVILLKNVDPSFGLVNGARGVIVDFRDVPQSERSEIPRQFREMKMPYVQFKNVRVGGDGGDGELKLILPHEWTTTVGHEVVSSRFQVPLKAAWSLSVHKSQGMTIPHLAVNLAGIFEFGQAYVALSRATMLDQMILLAFDPKAFKAHPKVKQFYCLLEGKTPTLLPTNNLNLNTNTVQKSTSEAYSTSNNRPYGHGSTQLGKRSHTNNLTPPHHGTTPEQMRRAEENRRRALSIRTKDSSRVELFHSSGAHGSGGSQQVPSRNQLTPEQKTRMEENRNRARAIRARKAQQQQQSSTGIIAPSSQSSEVLDLT